MRDLIDFTIQCMNELDRIGIPYGNVIDVTINTRAKKRWGQCRKVPGGFTININVVLLDEKNDVDGLRNTIFHELLRTCPDCWNHGTQWKAYAAMIRRELGYNIQRTSSAEEKGVITEPETERTPKYQIVCNSCGHIWERYKMCKAIKRIENFRCGYCNGRLSAFSDGFKIAG